MKDDDKRKRRQEKRDVKREGNRRRRRTLKRQLDENPDEAPFAGYEFKFDSSAPLNLPKGRVPRKRRHEHRPEKSSSEEE
jgi:hypothetical protein